MGCFIGAAIIPVLAGGEGGTKPAILSAAGKLPGRPTDSLATRGVDEHLFNMGSIARQELDSLSMAGVAAISSFADSLLFGTGDDKASAGSCCCSSSGFASTSLLQSVKIELLECAEEGGLLAMEVLDVVLEVEVLFEMFETWLELEIKLAFELVEITLVLEVIEVLERRLVLEWLESTLALDVLEFERGGRGGGVRLSIAGGRGLGGAPTLFMFHVVTDMDEMSKALADSHHCTSVAKYKIYRILNACRGRVTSINHEFYFHQYRQN